MSVEYVGPITHHEVVVDGWSVPHLDAYPLEGGRIRLVLDDRFGLELDLAIATAERVVPWVADAMAVSAGYTCHPRDHDQIPNRLLPMRRIMSVSFNE
jgi:hypothetical protein